MSNTGYIIAEIIGLCGIIFAVWFPIYFNKRLQRKYGSLPNKKETVIININQRETTISGYVVIVPIKDTADVGVYQAERKIERSFSPLEYCEA
jgi:hypothetical protein